MKNCVNRSSAILLFSIFVLPLNQPFKSLAWGGSRRRQHSPTFFLPVTRTREGTKPLGYPT